MVRYQALDAWGLREAISARVVSTICGRLFKTHLLLDFTAALCSTVQSLNFSKRYKIDATSVCKIINVHSQTLTLSS